MSQSCALSALPSAWAHVCKGSSVAACYAGGRSEQASWRLCHFVLPTLLPDVQSCGAVLQVHWQAEPGANDSVVHQVMQAVGSGCSEATARRLLAACGHDSNKAVRLAKQALDALHRSWDQLDRDSSLSRPPSSSPLSQVRVKGCHL